MTDDRRQHITEAMAEAAGSRAFRNTGPAWNHMRSVWLAHADTALGVLKPELDQLREYTAGLEEQVIAMGGHQAAAEEYEAAIARVRALHQHNEDAGYCDLCSNHGDVSWPCATLRALDGADGEPRPADPALCAECGHPKGQHQDADEPVSVGLCAACDEADSDDAEHDYEPEEQQ